MCRLSESVLVCDGADLGRRLSTVSGFSSWLRSPIRRRYPMQEYLLHGVFYEEENEENENAR